MPPPKVSPDHLVVSEVFGPTFQGEGPHAGQHAYFVRLGLCNLACTWCDTKWTWDWDNYDPDQELTIMTPADVFAAVWDLVPIGVPPSRIVISGGEPLIQQRALYSFVQTAAHAGFRMEIETAGTLQPSGDLIDWVDSWNVSPKLDHSGNAKNKRYKPSVLYEFTQLRTAFKFVVTHPSDLHEVEGIVEECDIPRYQVWIMPEGVTPESTLAHAQAVANDVLQRGWNLTMRQHVQLWPDIHRGR
jgi:7-carboxy-7-deazaguanine synthase